MGEHAFIASGLTRGFVEGTIAEFYQAEQATAAKDLNPQARTAVAAALRKILCADAEKRVAALDTHEQAARQVAEVESPKSRRDEARAVDPVRVHALRELAKDASAADVAALARRAISSRDYTVSAALQGVNREWDAETAAVVQQAIALRTPKFEAAIAEVAVVRAARARIVAALDLVAPDATPRALSAANEARAFEVGGQRFSFNQKTLDAAYETVGVDPTLTMPSRPTPTPEMAPAGA